MSCSSVEYSDLHAYYEEREKERYISSYNQPNMFSITLATRCSAIRELLREVGVVGRTLSIRQNAMLNCRI